MPSEQGVQYWYYTRDLPQRAVGVAKVTAPRLTPAQLTSINNTVVDPGDLGIWKSTTPSGSPPDWSAITLNRSVVISGSTGYLIDNQFFEVTNVVSDQNNPMYYKHQLPQGVIQIVVTDLDGVLIPNVDSLVQNNVFYHSLDGSPYYIRFVTPAGNLETYLLQYVPVIDQVSVATTDTGYLYSGRNLVLPSSDSFYIRFVADNGYMLMPTYEYLPNTPWFPRIRFGLTPPPMDWGLQPFSISRGYQLASYVSGKVLNSSVVEFERKDIYTDASQLPDILIFNADNSLKYALDGSTSNTPKRKGTLYNWKRGAIQSMDPALGRISLSVELDPTDMVYGFYNYYERDVIYTSLDINPFTNPVIKNSIVQFYVKFDSGNASNNLFHQILDDTGAPIPGLSNDPSPNVGTNQVFAQLAVGASISTSDFTLEDVRVRGGGLIPSKQTIPQSVNMWDIGYWDGKPYPVAGAIVAYLPLSILDTLTRSDIKGKVASILPMGALAVIRYVDAQGQEYV